MCDQQMLVHCVERELTAEASSERRAWWENGRHAVSKCSFEKGRGRLTAEFRAQGGDKKMRGQQVLALGTRKRLTTRSDRDDETHTMDRHGPVAVSKCSLKEGGRLTVEVAATKGMRRWYARG